jgi:hypothetical protein
MLQHGIMPIIPDTKNWTWVLEAPCEDCGFDASTFVEQDVAALVLANAARWPAVLSRSDAAVRPNDDTWSALEYAAHVRDVFQIFAVRVQLMLDEDNPRFANWNQDDTAIAERYSEQDPQDVAAALTANAAAIAALFDSIPDDAWGRPGHRGDGADFTIASLATYFVHDPTHHLWDVKG